ncbi:hypothetical protein SOVF_120010 [Spinacia oleracea]|nr:hypothetical protein SOVF_120010 [Spinacia oleracea]
MPQGAPVVNKFEGTEVASCSVLRQALKQDILTLALLFYWILVHREG